jgi:subtilisin family serine protease
MKPLKPAVQTVQRAQSGVPAAIETRFVPNQVMFTVNGSPEIADAIGQKHHLVRLYSNPIALIGGGMMNCYRIADNRPVADVVRDLETEQKITSAQPNYIYKLDGVETAPESLASAQYALAKMHLDEAHRMTEGDKTLVAVIDSGIDESHPDIAGSVIDRFDAIGGEIKSETHGTAMAGAISAHGALTGAAPHANLLAIRAFNGNAATSGASGTTFHIVKALNWAYEHHAQVANMSFAGTYDPLLALAINTAHQKGMIIVAAAGNEGPHAQPAYPASDRNVIAVTATDRDDKVFSAANRGSYISLAAPGTEILSAAPSNSYQFSSGTSIAAAELSGVIALLLAEKPDLTDDMIRQILKDTAHNLHGSSPDEFGAGLGDAQKAVAAAALLRDQPGKIADAKPE